MTRNLGELAQKYLTEIKLSNNLMIAEINEAFAALITALGQNTGKRREHDLKIFAQRCAEHRNRAMMEKFSQDLHQTALDNYDELRAEEHLDRIASKQKFAECKTLKSYNELVERKLSIAKAMEKKFEEASKGSTLEDLNAKFNAMRELGHEVRKFYAPLFILCPSMALRGQMYTKRPNIIMNNFYIPFLTTHLALVILLCI